jgi:DNA-binding SARP family transcriptional activator
MEIPSVKAAGGLARRCAGAHRCGETAVLALAAGEPVTVERLIACLWGDQPPLTARNTLQNYV